MRWQNRILLRGILALVLLSWSGSQPLGAAQPGTGRAGQTGGAPSGRSLPGFPTMSLSRERGAMPQHVPGSVSRGGSEFRSPSFAPSVPSRPSFEHPTKRPSIPHFPTRPSIVPSPITRPEQLPSLGARPLPSTRPIPLPSPISPPSSRPIKPPPSTRPPIAGRPPIVDPPVVRPPVTTLPGTRPPGTRPPGARPPIATLPGELPPVTRPPGVRPPIARPPVIKPPVTIPPGVRYPRPDRDLTIINHHNYYNNYHHYGPSCLPHYYSSLHYHWGPTGWSYVVYRPAFCTYYQYYGQSGILFGIGGSRIVYVNPFFVATPTVVLPYLNYSRPIPVPYANDQESAQDLVRSEQAIRRFDDARGLFARGEYGRATDLIEEAIQLLPGDPNLHQFRALVLFARARYTDAAAAIYAVLAVSPGWDWQTISALYPDPQIYEQQLRQLVEYSTANPNAVEARFLLAYHCLVIDDRASAVALLEEVAKAKPGDRVIRDLLEAARGAL